jgi:YidC/Oxa1 family membrane protein insertase
MGKMKALAPLMNAVREKYKDDKMNLNRELANIYKDKGINPFSGMLPMLIQIPFFFALYKVLFVGIDLRQEKFFGWICDLSAADPTSVFNLFGLIPFTPPSILQVGILPIIMGITMYLQQVLNPKSMSNNGQMKAIAYMPLIFTFILASFPSGLVIYWIVNNLFSVTHQFLVDKIYKNEISKVEASLVIKK